MKATTILAQACRRCRSRLEQDDLGVRLWGYFCIVLFLIALTISMLGCADASYAPRLEGASTRTGAPVAGDVIGGALGSNPIASVTVRF